MNNSIECVYKIGDMIIDDKRNLTILDKKYFIQGNRKSWYYKYHCNKCGYECEDGYFAGQYKKATWFSKQQLGTKKTNCACCSNKIIVPTINSISVTHPELVPYFINRDAEKYTIYSNQRISMKCPFCGNVKENVTISSLYRQGFSCNICSHTISIGERILYSLLTQLCVDFKKEYVCNISGINFRYDFYLPDFKTIIEVHGEQHYKDSSRIFKRNQFKVDEIKETYALRNGINYYIIIDAKQSSFDYIKKSILESELKDVINLSVLDWNEIHINLFTKNHVKDICEYWENNPNADYIELENVFHFSESTLRKYVKLGMSIGWCKRKNSKRKLKKLYGTYTRKYPLLDLGLDCRNDTTPLKYDNRIFFKSVRLCSENSDEVIGKHYPESTIRYKLKRQGTKFEEITKQEFNTAFEKGNQCFGTPFDEVIL